MSLADRVAVMSDGLLNQIDTPRKIYDHPADLFIHRFHWRSADELLGRIDREGGEGRRLSAIAASVLHCRRELVLRSCLRGCCGSAPWSPADSIIR